MKEVILVDPLKKDNYANTLEKWLIWLKPNVCLKLCDNNLFVCQEMSLCTVHVTNKQHVG